MALRLCSQGAVPGPVNGSATGRKELMPAEVMHNLGN